MFSQILRIRIYEVFHLYFSVEKENKYLVLVFSIWKNQNKYHVRFGGTIRNSYSENSWKNVMSPSMNYFFSWRRLEGNLEKSTWKSWTSLDKKVDWTSNIWWLLETWMYLWGLRQDQNTHSGHWRLAWHVFKCSFSNGWRNAKLSVCIIIYWLVMSSKIFSLTHRILQVLIGLLFLFKIYPYWLITTSKDHLFLKQGFKNEWTSSK